MEAPAAQPAALIGFLDSLADPTRLRLLRLLEREELGVTELIDVLQLPQSTVSRHLKALSDQGWVRSRSRGPSNFYALRNGELPGAARRLWHLVKEQTEGWATARQDGLRLEARLRERSASQAFFARSAERWDRLRQELYGSAFGDTALLALLGRELVAVARRHNDAVHCSFVDVDGLKGVNDRYGHEAGDDVIAAVAEALRRTSRDSDVVARWGGDEFVLVGLGAGVPPLDLERRVQAFLLRDPGLAEHLAGIRISVGRSMLEPWDTGDLDNLLWTADRDMYVRRALKGRTVPPVVTLDRTEHQRAVAHVAGKRTDLVE